jgi:uncharacterized sulfatase
MTDTQRPDMLGCYGNRMLYTPNLDDLAGGGMRFDRAYTCQPVCGPARSAIFTGLYPHANGSWANSMPLGDNVKTIGQRLSDAGIACGYAGKWHLDGHDYFGAGRCPGGWRPETWYDMRRYLEEMGECDRVRSRVEATSDDPDLSAAFTFGHRVSNRAIDFIRGHAHEPFFLTVSYDEPHHPYVCPPPFSELFRDYQHPRSANVMDTLADKPEHHRVWAGDLLQRDRSGLTIQHPRFFACNSFVDHELGRVLQAVERHAPGAMVIYTSDHGDMLLSHGLTNKGPAMYEEITRVPLLVRWPGRVGKGLTCPHPISHIDLAPTIMDSFGLPLPRWLDGRSFLPTLRDPAVRTNDAVFIEFGRYETDHDGFGGFQPIRCVFDGRHKLVINLLTSDELYDLSLDPHEMKNLIAAPEHAPIRDALHDRLLNWMNQTRDPFRGYYWERRPWRQDARPATWAYTGCTRQREHEEYEPRQLDYDTGLPMTAAVRSKT